MKSGPAELFKSFRKIVLPILTLLLLLKITFSSFDTNTYSLLQNIESLPINHKAITQLLSPGITNNSEKTGEKQQLCNIFVGKWVPNPKGPYYTNETNCVIDDRQNCMKYGRPDSDFLHWRWKPNDCELPLFDANQFLEIVRGKTLAFVGDSVARNQMQSLVCLLSSADDAWASQVDKADIVIISGGQWFFRPFLYYENDQLIGYYLCNDKNVTKQSHFYGYRMAFRTAFKTFLNLKKLKGRLVMLRPYSPSHFENGEWNNGGNCNRTRPFKKEEMKLDGYEEDVYDSIGGI
ncbi:hypothetical protein MTR67_010642 [Solanum verrucosum]|uniref:Trichome birefringence-like N-terminal domain-containing protein n=1 Tax=Solanum verrucosum TaxID=315347 RepID=A0AAF0TED5_SOLVR|nr:hypothetical protein MTR67_010642 [Solanum verrucosum]